MSDEGYGQERTSSTHEVPAIVCGLLVFVASFLPWYGVSFGGGSAEAGVTGTYNAWHGLAGIGVILVLMSLVVTAAEPFMGESFSPFALPVLGALLSAVGAALVVIRSLSLPTSDIPNTTTSLRWGGWILLVLVVVQVLINVLRAVHAGDHRRQGPVVPPPV